ncbi:hypothetical protein CQ018_12425 [Arthrobacter sp. MYb227]|uniref:hypothetical protein n=1 Tax=Arthrobacter sp. MYb227 TaxID=1848601 RepID=UPI000CFE2563|nr:hypothetical protein [Arthrobacter sp. MYb227]PQZ92303.1 hypothetical protein CQ018_12425 [Arthrobacter sp. MYb227]
MKKIFLGAASVLCILGLAGCASDGGAAGNSAAVAESSAAAESAAAASSAAASSAAAESSASEASAKAAAEEAKAEAEKAAAEQEAAQKEATAKAKKEKADAKAKIDNAKPMTSRDLARLVKKPDSAKGDVVVVYGNITQFDAATGDCTFRANVAHTRMSSSWKYEHNSMFVGGDGEEECPKLDDVVADDNVKIVATSLGSFSYDTQVGGNTTVPLFKVEKISLLK